MRLEHVRSMNLANLRIAESGMRAHLKRCNIFGAAEAYLLHVLPLRRWLRNLR